jgi:hypothetical protein
MKIIWADDEKYSCPIIKSSIYPSNKRDPLALIKYTAE